MDPQILINILSSFKGTSPYVDFFIYLILVIIVIFTIKQQWSKKKSHDIEIKEKSFEVVKGNVDTLMEFSENDQKTKKILNEEVNKLREELRNVRSESYRKSLKIDELEYKIEEVNIKHEKEIKDLKFEITKFKREFDKIKDKKYIK
jgi:hypothetical protein